MKLFEFSCPFMQNKKRKTSRIAHSRAIFPCIVPGLEGEEAFISR